MMPPSIKVEFRFLQVMVHSIADERVTIGIVHFDGVHVRFAFRPERSPKGVQDLAQVVEGYKETLSALRKEVPPGFSLSTYQGLPHGDMGFLTWHSTRVAYTKDSWNHFKQIVLEIGLVPS